MSGVNGHSTQNRPTGRFFLSQQEREKTVESRISLLGGHGRGIKVPIEDPLANQPGQMFGDEFFRHPQATVDETGLVL